MPLIPHRFEPMVMSISAKVDPYQFFSDYYRTDDKERTDSEKLRKIVRDLNRIGRPREVHAALFGYLKNDAKNAEPWMYEYSWSP